MNKLFQIFKIKKKPEDLINSFLKNGKIPWSNGYIQYKWHLINKNINDITVLNTINKGQLPKGFGHRVDERIVEYPWIFSNLTNEKERLLDAGSTFNFQPIVSHSKIVSKDLTIYTFAPEKNCFNNKGVSYVYGDLRDMPFKDNWFDTIVSQSTIEHIDMDNSIYGYDISHNENQEKKSYQYLRAVDEMVRVLKSSGNLLLTFPFGKFENHGFFQQFDEEMLDKTLGILEKSGTFNTTFFKYTDDGWTFSDREALATVISFNPHSGKGKLNDNAAHCRGVACINFIKS